MKSRAQGAWFFVLLLIIDIIAVTYSAFLAIGFINFTADFSIFDLFRSEFFLCFCIVTVVCSNLIFGCYSVAWKKKVSFNDAVRVAVSFVFSTALLLVFDFLYRYFNERPYFSLLEDIKVTRPAILMLCLFAFVIMGAVRAATRIFNYLINYISSLSNKKSRKKVLIFGAGEAGVYLANLIHEHPEYQLNPVLFIDDNSSFWRRRIEGIRVLPVKHEALKENIIKYGINEVIVAIPTAPRELLQFVFNCCRDCNCSMRRFGNINDVFEGDLSHSVITDINFEDLLKRDSVNLDTKSIYRFVKGKTVLVTGGVGSIGSEICRQVLAFDCKKLIIFDFNENGLFEINNEFKEKYDTDRYVLKLGSVRDSNRLTEVFEEYHPQIVLHAAAHKHVPMMEINPLEAVKNNVYGTYKTGAIADLYGAEKFILISTDKAVNPTNIMGASKRMAEMVIHSLNAVAKNTCYASVRFGNVLGSNGSVVPIFRKQIECGGPVTLTHPDMRRYFMTIPEAVQLVLEAGAMAKGSETFVLDMGEPVKIYDLACDLIKLYGYVPNQDIEIQITGLRPGEKLFEEIMLNEEEVTKTPNNKIFVLKPTNESDNNILDELDELSENMNALKNINLYSTVKRFVPSFNHNEQFV